MAADRTTTGPDRSIPLRRVLRRILVVLVLLVLAATLAYRAAYGSWWSGPTRIEYCGRTYLAATSGLTLDEVRRRTSQTALPGDAPYPLEEVGTVPPVVGGALLAAVTPAERRAQLGVPCTMTVYLQTGEDRYREYPVSGGP